MKFRHLKAGQIWASSVNNITILKLNREYANIEFSSTYDPALKKHCTLSEMAAWIVLVEAKLLNPISPNKIWVNINEK